MKPFIQSLVALACAWMLVSGCNRTPSSAPPGRDPLKKVAYGMISWVAPGPNSRLYGIEWATLYFVGEPAEAVLVWSDAIGATTSAPSSSALGVQWHVSLLALFSEDRRVEVRGHTEDGMNGQVLVNGTTYDLVNGNVFLVSTRSDPPEIKQLKRDLTMLTFERDSLKAFGMNDAEIVAFFAKAAESR